ncbi:MAG TPA: helix-turn-helix transcriptional regulator [Candidatus Saccharimonadales bacterium]|nr:helix-turn-helix transcriptional regulator [Candidatus Saccharimonadales bacterium]
MDRTDTPGEILKKARLKKGWTQEEVAKKAGLGQNTYPKLERGDNMPSPESAIKLMHALDIDQSRLPALLGQPDKKG